MTAPPQLPTIRPRNVVVFSGHMIDTPDRPSPRFPPSAEPAVRRRIAARLDDWGIGPDDLAISGAARGGDILFAELCHERGATVWLFLARPVPEHLEDSVRLPDSSWDARFQALRAARNVHTFLQPDFLPNPEDGLGVHERNNLWMLDAARKIAPSPEALRAILVWDEKPAGDGPGGTSDFAARVRELGGSLAPVIDPMR